MIVKLMTHFLFDSETKNRKIFEKFKINEELKLIDYNKVM